MRQQAMSVNLIMHHNPATTHHNPTTVMAVDIPLLRLFLFRWFHTLGLVAIITAGDNIAKNRSSRLR
jgi:hypothetical protein